MHLLNVWIHVSEICTDHNLESRYNTHEPELHFQKRLLFLSTDKLCVRHQNFIFFCVGGRWNSRCIVRRAILDHRSTIDRHKYVCRRSVDIKTFGIFLNYGWQTPIGDRKSTGGRLFRQFIEAMPTWLQVIIHQLRNCLCHSPTAKSSFGSPFDDRTWFTDNWIRQYYIFVLDNEKMFKCMTMQFFHEFITDKNNDVHYVILNHPFNDVTFPTKFS